MTDAAHARDGAGAPGSGAAQQRREAEGGAGAPDALKEQLRAAVARAEADIAVATERLGEVDAALHTLHSAWEAGDAYREAVEVMLRATGDPAPQLPAPYFPALSELEVGPKKPPVIRSVAARSNGAAAAAAVAEPRSAFDRVVSGAGARGVQRRPPATSPSSSAATLPPRALPPRRLTRDEALLAAVARFPLIVEDQGVASALPYTTAPSLGVWHGWHVGRRKASERLRARRVADDANAALRRSGAPSITAWEAVLWCRAQGKVPPPPQIESGSAGSTQQATARGPARKRSRQR